MDYVDGTDAGRLQHDRYPEGMPAADVAEIVAAVADALDYAHQRNLLHRDVKPANILVAKDDQRILLADFEDRPPARRPERVDRESNMTVGTVSYAAPEQLMGERLDGRADQYALAATAYHLLTGSPPFHHTNPAVVISQHLGATPPVMGDRRPELAALDPVLAKALAKNPDDRFERCADFARALGHRVGGDHPDETRAARVTPPHWPITGAAGRDHPCGTGDPVGRRHRLRDARSSTAPTTRGPRREPPVRPRRRG